MSRLTSLVLVASGVHLKRNSESSSGVTAVRVIFFASYAIYAFSQIETIYRWSKSPRKPSFVDTTIQLSQVVSLITPLQLFKLYNNQQFASILENEMTKYRSFASNSALHMLFTVSFATATMYGEKSLVAFVILVASLPLFTLLFGFVFFYSQIMLAVCAKQQDILDMMTNRIRPISLQRLEHLKRSIRQTVSITDEHCGSVLVLYHIKMFLAIIKAISVFYSKDGNWTFGGFMNQAIHFVQIVVISAYGSKLDRICDLTERVALRHRLTPQLTSGELHQVRNLVRVQERWDAFHLAVVFPVNLTTLFAFFVTCSTITATVVQFDYKIMARIQSTFDSVNETSL